MLRFCMKLAWYGVVWQSMLWFFCEMCMLWYAMEQYGVVSYVMVWHVMLSCGEIVWFDF